MRGMTGNELLQQNTAGYRIFRLVNGLFMLLLWVVFLYPLANVISNSMSSGPELLAGEITFYPRNVDFFGWRMLFHNRVLGAGYANSVFYAAAGTASNLLLISLVAYPLSRRRLVFRSALSFYLAFTMLFSGGLIPTFLLVKSLGLYDSRAWMIMAHFLPVFHIVMLRTFYQGIPDSLEDSARIDGCSDPQIMFRIYFPLSKPILATLALFSVVAYWNDYFTGLIYLSDTAKFPLQMIIRDYLIPAEGTVYAANDIFYQELNSLRVAGGLDAVRMLQLEINLRNVAVVASSAPLVIVMTAVHRYFRTGMLVGALRD